MEPKSRRGLRHSVAPEYYSAPATDRLVVWRPHHEIPEMAGEAKTSAGDPIILPIVPRSGTDYGRPSTLARSPSTSFQSYLNAARS
jgi:hypothetical protein